MMKNIPHIIYLQTGLEEYGETIEDFNELDSSLVSWCADRIYSDDLEFISVSSVLAEIDKMKDYANATDDYERAEFTINVLKRLIKE